ncbi:hypothetical protein PILCRDRAFT_824625 [Piloderma croceum F 1598]|uniref:Uncharacterized protein n=1 Tax=Piloderma croceum (strain F 1598) TaxID=765440 RepID=A0A0C3FE20_PILCF|nr:hypothetical protein PILCRDRAFT_824625 [Piloderma croceum F 1598]
MSMYNIDDTNATISYKMGQSNNSWFHKNATWALGNVADPAKCYNRTYTVNAYQCGSSDGCDIQIPFTGSGISVFVIQSSNVLNTTITLDSNLSTIASMPNLPGPGNPLVYDFALYTVQYLAAANHILDISLSDYTFGSGTTSDSMLRFDYVAVNETSPTVVSPSPSGASTTSLLLPGSSTMSHAHSATGSIIGGAVGGSTVIAAVIFALLCYWRQQRSRKAAVLNPQPDPGVDTKQTDFDPSVALYGSHLPSSMEYTQPLIQSGSSNSTISDYPSNRRANSYIPPVSNSHVYTPSVHQQNVYPAVAACDGNIVSVWQR